MSWPCDIDSGREATTGHDCILLASAAVCWFPALQSGSRVNVVSSRTRGGVINGTIDIVRFSEVEHPGRLVLPGPKHEPPTWIRAVDPLNEPPNGNPVAV